MMASIRYSEAFDKCGVCIAGVCLFHCLAVPLIFILSPTVSSMLPDLEAFHVPLVVSAIIVCVYATLKGWQQHAERLPVYLGGMGIFLLATSLVIGDEHVSGEVTASVGAIIIAITHIFNIRLCRKCGSNCTPESCG
ncbi:MerC domain-containing protein [Kordiimonas sp. SCSIO 12610]|uniref:MerC domain-containing protein n=1 Tax=Kordiimonas sp. SCSIO 12610 TaxID=2829597 RepID=UPI00210E5CE2|nr:MerC domain-containing protein [Kordiimonas sp. SCSIO 12610]UTW56028.1 MerC domain-containing protein [Kordiimonas sp. SCSIO 12610]